MPGIDGYETCRRLKKEASLKNIPVIFLSAMSETFDKVKAFNCGGVDYITKPIQINELLSRVSTHLSISILQKQLAEANKTLEIKVEERTKQLNLTNKALLLEMKHRKLAEQQTLSAIIEAEEKERTNFAREMHDGIGPQLSNISMYLNELLTGEPEMQLQHTIIGKTIDMVNGAIHSVVEISHAMSPHVLRNYGVAHAIESFCNKISHENSPVFILDL